MRATISVNFKRSELVSLGKSLFDAMSDNREVYTLTIVVPDENQITIRKQNDEEINL